VFHLHSLARSGSPHRKSCRSEGPADVPPLPPIRSLAYLHPVIEELLEHPVPDNYVEYLRLKVRRIAGDKSIRRMSRNIRFQMIANTPPVNSSSISKWLCDEQPRHGLAHRLHFSGRFSRR
jgi:hypothetical protein